MPSSLKNSLIAQLRPCDILMSAGSSAPELAGAGVATLFAPEPGGDERVIDLGKGERNPFFFPLLLRNPA